jgi:hypothetical protein
MHPIRRLTRQTGMPTMELLSLIIAAIVWIALLSTIEDDPFAR